MNGPSSVCHLLTWYNIVPQNCYVAVSVWARLFVPKTHCMTLIKHKKLEKKLLKTFGDYYEVSYLLVYSKLSITLHSKYISNRDFIYSRTSTSRSIVTNNDVVIYQFREPQHHVVRNHFQLTLSEHHLLGQLVSNI